MSTNKKINTKFEIAKTEPEEKMKTKMNKYKFETSSSIDMTLLTIYWNK